MSRRAADAGRTAHDVPLIENVVRSSLDLGWTLCSTATWSFTRPWSVREVHYAGHYVSVLRSAAPAEFRLAWSGIARHRYLIPPGGISLYPAGTVVHRSEGAAMDVRAFTLDRSAVSTVLDLDVDDLTFRPVIGQPDPYLAGFADILAIEADHGTRDPLFLESIIAAIAHHLRRRYGRVAGADAAIGGLQTLKRRRLLDLIEAHLHRPLSLTEMAAAVELSPSHLVRACKGAFGLTPRQLVIGRRVERVKRLLSESDDRLDDVARRAGFSDASHMSRAFRKAVGTTPGRYRKTRRSPMRRAPGRQRQKA